jgi:hypothetical protein
MVRIPVVVSVHWPSSSTTVVRPFDGLDSVTMLGLRLMEILFGQRATEVDMSLGLLWAIVIVAVSILIGSRD